MGLYKSVRKGLDGFYEDLSHDDQTTVIDALIEFLKDRAEVGRGRRDQILNNLRFVFNAEGEEPDRALKEVMQ